MTKPTLLPNIDDARFSAFIAKESAFLSPAFVFLFGTWFKLDTTKIVIQFKCRIVDFRRLS